MFKKVLGLALAFSLAITGGAFAGDQSLTVQAATKKSFDSPATNISIATAEEIGNDTFKAGSVSAEDAYGERWYKFTNPYSKEAVAEVTFSHTDGNYWPDYAFYSKNGKAIEGLDYSGYFTSSGLTIKVGLEAGESKYLRVFKPNHNAAWMISLSITQSDEPNSFQTANVVKSGKRINGKLDFAGDEDVFKIKAKKAGKLVVSVSNNDCGNDILSKFEFPVYNKSKVAKKNVEVKKTKTGKATIKVKKGQVVYVKVNAKGMKEQSKLGSYSIKTTIKK